MSARTRALEVLSRLPEGDVIGAEIGVFRGQMSADLLTRTNLRLYMVDNWEPFAIYTSEHQNQFEQNKNKQNALEITEFASDRRIVMHMTSAQASFLVPNMSLDFVFLDADHSENGVMRDIDCWIGKLKDKGLLCGHDYNNPVEDGVKPAIDRFVNDNYKLELGLDFTWFVRV